MLGKVISRNSLLLAMFAAAATAGIAGTYLGTKDTIAAQKRAAEQKALLEIISRERHDNSMLDDTLPVADQEFLRLNEDKRIYIAKQGSTVVGFIFPAVAPDGYTGDIEMIVGVNADGSLAGVRVLSHRETPGLGDKVELAKSDWVLSFNGTSLSNPSEENWGVKKDGGHFDQFTGATITPRAVTQAVYRTLKYYQANQEVLLRKATTAEEVHSHE